MLECSKPLAFYYWHEFDATISTKQVTCPGFDNFSSAATCREYNRIGDPILYTPLFYTRNLLLADESISALQRPVQQTSLLVSQERSAAPWNSPSGKAKGASTKLYVRTHYGDIIYYRYKERGDTFPCRCSLSRCVCTGRHNHPKAAVR